MSRYCRIIFFGLVVFFVGCSTNHPVIGKKSFQNEDSLIIKALFYENFNPKIAIKIFNKLVKKTHKYIYEKEIIRLTFEEKQYKKTIQLVKNFIKNYPKYKYKVINYEIYSYLRLNKENKALKVALKILEQNRDISAYKLVAYIFIQKQDYKNAIKYLKSAYSISHSPEVLAQMGDIFFKYLNKPNEAISYYQTHIRLYGCNPLICDRLANIYRFLYDYDNLIAIYKRLYNSTGNIEYANKIVYLYVENGEYKKAIQFIKYNNLGHSLLVMVYKNRFSQFHNYKDAYELYKWTRNINYFFEYSVYKFEKSKKGLIDIKNVIANLDYIIKKNPKPLYLNYLGYLLIDYNINPLRGVKLVKEALKEYPNYDEFLDSLAWGYYKLHKCKLAYQIIKKVNLKQKAVLKHKKLIRRCYDIAKNHKKDKRKLKKK